MNVNLVSLTQAQMPDLLDRTPEELIIYIARVSNPANQHNWDTAPRLMAFLIRQGHWSPFEMVDMTVEIVTSRAIAAQILRHRSFSFQEFSQRYAEVTDIEPVQLRAKADTDRQSSTLEANPLLPTGDTAQDAVNRLIEKSTETYKMLLDAGIAKECARMVLPMTTQTRLYMKGSIRSWIHYLKIRTDGHAQLEHQQIAQAIQAIFIEQFPNLATALELN